MSDISTEVVNNEQADEPPRSAKGGTLPWRLAARIAWRESRASLGRFAFIVAAVAVGVAALVGVRGFSNLFRDVLLKEARTLMAADLSVRDFRIPTTSQWAAVQELEALGVKRTWVTESVSMLSAGPDTVPVLVSVKAIEPDLYPFYGEFRASVPGTLREILQADSVLVAPDLMIRFDLEPGDTIRLGSATFRIAGEVDNEPDRMTGSLNAGPRVMMSRAGLDRTGLITEGSRAAQRLLFRFPDPTPGTPTVDVQKVRDRLKETFPTAMISDFRQVHPAINRGLESATTFLSLVSLIALIVGSLGVGMAMQAHLQQKLDSIAIMKAVGARSGQVLRIYGIQTLMLGASGALLGVLAGTLVQRSFPLLLERYFPVAAKIGWEPWSALQGIGVGVLTTLLFTLPTLLDIRRIKPNVILRREMAEISSGWRRWLRESRTALFTGALLVSGIGAIASWLSNSFRLGAYFVGAIVVSLLLLNLTGWLLLRALRFLIERKSLQIPASLRHGMGNLYRPGNHARAALVALGVGVTFTLTVYLVQGSMLRSLVASVPPTLPNVFFINIQPPQQAPLLEIIKSQPGLRGDPVIQSSVSIRLDRVGDRRMDDYKLEGFDRRFLRERNARETPVPPEGTTIVDGTWWNSPPGPGEPAFVSIAQDAAKALQIELGTQLRWVAAGQPVEATVLAIHKTDEGRMDAGFEFLFSPGALQALPTIYFGAVRMNPADVPGLQRATYNAFPSVTVINIADVLAIVQEVLDQVTMFVEFISLFAILAGVIILSSSVAGTRLRRIREVAILKTLGATRRRLSIIFSVEFTLLGFVAGLMGAILASGFSAILLTRMFEADYEIAWLPVLVCIFSTVVVANVAGWLASARILDQKPLIVLRGD
ncbi:MAG: FtsX-like permease family protein [Bryobacterales bacterium]|nr:FtsX-like permease family protein [Bryobacterales bacterium]